MSLLSLEKRTVIEGLNVSNSLIHLGAPTTIVGGVNYKKIVCMPESPTTATNYLILKNAATGEPVNTTNQVIRLVIFEGGPALESSSSITTVELYFSETPTSAGPFTQETNFEYGQVNDKVLYELNNVDISGVTQLTSPYLAISAGNGGTISAGSVTITLYLTELPTAL